MQAQPRSAAASRNPAPERHALGLMLLAGALCATACATAFVALIHAPLPEELVLASLGHEATVGAIGRPATP